VDISLTLTTALAKPPIHFLGSCHHSPTTILVPFFCLTHLDLHPSCSPPIFGIPFGPCCHTRCPVFTSCPSTSAPSVLYRRLPLPTYFADRCVLVRASHAPLQVHATGRTRRARWNKYTICRCRRPPNRTRLRYAHTTSLPLAPRCFWHDSLYCRLSRRLRYLDIRLNIRTRRVSTGKDIAFCASHTAQVSMLVPWMGLLPPGAPPPPTTALPARHAHFTPGNMAIALPHTCDTAYCPVGTRCCISPTPTFPHLHATHCRGLPPPAMPWQFRTLGLLQCSIPKLVTPSSATCPQRTLQHAHCLSAYLPSPLVGRCFSCRTRGRTHRVRTNVRGRLPHAWRIVPSAFHSARWDVNAHARLGRGLDAR